MLYTAEDDLRLCTTLDINPTQLMFIKMLVKDPALSDQDWKRKTYERALHFGNAVKGIKPADIADLVNRNIVVDHNTTRVKQYDYYDIHDKFHSLFRLHYKGMPQDLIDAYPEYITIEGKKFSTKGVSDHAIALTYLKAINNSPEEHAEVLLDVEYGKRHDLIRTGIIKFVNGALWRGIRTVRLSNITSNLNQGNVNIA